MKKFEVVIRATITKTIEVEANDEDQATELAQQQFSVECDGDESYNQDMLSVEEVK